MHARRPSASGTPALSSSSNSSSQWYKVHYATVAGSGGDLPDPLPLALPVARFPVVLAAPGGRREGRRRGKGTNVHNMQVLGYEGGGTNCRSQLLKAGGRWKKHCICFFAAAANGGLVLVVS